jgi:hypothetical protein
LSSETIKATGWWSASTAEQVAAILHCSLSLAKRIGPGMAMPFFKPGGSPLGYTRFKPHRPFVGKKAREKARKEGKEPKPGTGKYLSPFGVPNHVYAPPGTIEAEIQDVDIDVILTEGEKKSLKGRQEGFLTLSLTGVWGGVRPRKKDALGKPVGPRELHPDLAKVAWQGRRVYICFDSDAWQNSEVRKAAKVLADLLEAQGAKVRILFFPADDGKKVGLDDFLIKHDAKQLRALLKSKATISHKQIKILRKPRFKHGCPYSTKGNMTWHHTYDRNGEAVHCLANFTATITQQTTTDDSSGDTKTHLVVEGVLAGGAKLPPLTVASSKFVAMTWPVEGWGAEAVLNAGLGVKDHMRAAIQLTSKNIKKRHVFTHVGWRKINGEWKYLHKNGAIGADGLTTDIDVELDGSLIRYCLPHPSSGKELVQAVTASLALLELTHPRIMGPSLGAAYRAPLGTPADCSLFLFGPTGSGKSEVSALCQQHYGPEMDRQHLPGAWTSTSNAMESLAFLGKDGLTVFDDFKAAGTRSETEALNSKADRLFRSIGNGSSRGRCWADSSLRGGKPPQGFVLATGEDRPSGQSCAARRLDIRFRGGRNDNRDVILASLTPYQQKAREGVYAQSMSGYLSWLARRGLDAVRKELAEKYHELRSLAVISAHPRTPGTLADLGCGWHFFLSFAVECGAITEVERENIWLKAWEGILLAGKEHDAEIAGSDPVYRFFNLLSGALASGHYCLRDTSGDVPRSVVPSGLGWQRSPEGEWTTKAECIGYLDDQGMYLIPEAAFGAVQKRADNEGERLGISKDHLGKRLGEEKKLTTKDDGRSTVKKDVAGRRMRLWHLQLSDLFADLDGIPPPVAGHSGQSGQTPQKHEENGSFSRPAASEPRGTSGAERGECPAAAPVCPAAAPQDHENGEAVNPAENRTSDNSAPTAPNAPHFQGVGGPGRANSSENKPAGQNGRYQTYTKKVKGKVVRLERGIIG